MAVLRTVGSATSGADEETKEAAMTEDRKEAELWLFKLAADYDGVLPYRNETEVLEWLKHKAEETGDRDTKKRFMDLVEEAIEFGGTDDWGTISGERVKFARFLELLRSRAK